MKTLLVTLASLLAVLGFAPAVDAAPDRPFKEANVWLRYDCRNGRAVELAVLRTQRAQVSLTERRSGWTLVAWVDDGARIRESLWAPGSSRYYSASRGRWLENGMVWEIPRRVLACPR